MNRIAEQRAISSPSQLTRRMAGKRFLRPINDFLAIGIIALLTSSCVTPITIALINRSDGPIAILKEAKTFECQPDQLVSFVPGRKHHDIVIRTRRAILSYDLKPTPELYLDHKREKRLLLMFRNDERLYLLEPTDKPIESGIGVQPEGYPLSPNEGENASN